MKIAVTGGGGFIGSHIVDKLIQLGHEVMVLDNWSKGKQSNFSDNALGKNISVDLADYNMIAFSFALFKPDLVVHCASANNIPQSILQPEFFIDTNVKGTLNILEAMKYSGCKKIIYLSDIKVYGSQYEFPISEDAPLKPVDIYSQSKRLGEELIKSYRRLYGYEFNILRLGEVYGEKMTSGFILDCIKSLFEFQKLTIYGNGSEINDYVYVGDVVNSIIKSIQKLDNNIFNISYGAELKSGVIFELCKKHIGIDKTASFEEPKPYELSRMNVNVKNALSCIDWVAEVEINDGIKKTVEWYKNNSYKLDDTTPQKILKPHDLMEVE